MTIHILHTSPPPCFSFVTHEGLKEAQDKVSDYVVLMKDFPVNELLAANSMESIQLAVLAIFNHLKKLKNTQYPGNRAVLLIEAISRDLLVQLLKVLLVSIGCITSVLY